MQAKDNDDCIFFVRCDLPQKENDKSTKAKKCRETLSEQERTTFDDIIHYHFYIVYDNPQQKNKTIF